MELTPKIIKELQAPWPSGELQWVVVASSRDKKQEAWAPYVDAIQIQDRLDAVIGAADWETDFVPLEGGRTMICRLTVCGVTKSDVGEMEPSAQTDQPTKAAASDALKRAGVQWGMGRYLRGLALVWMEAGKGPPRSNAPSARTAEPPTRTEKKPAATPPAQSGRSSDKPPVTPPPAPPVQNGTAQATNPPSASAKPAPEAPTASYASQLAAFNAKHNLTAREICTMLNISPLTADGKDAPSAALNVYLRSVQTQKGIELEASIRLLLESLRAAIVARPVTA
jgi:hypothetical protein